MGNYTLAHAPRAVYGLGNELAGPTTNCSINCLRLTITKVFTQNQSMHLSFDVSTHSCSYCVCVDMVHMHVRLHARSSGGVYPQHVYTTGNKSLSSFFDH